VLAQPHAHQGRVVGRLETFDLQVVFGVAPARVADVVGETHVVGDLVEHALEQRRILAGHAAFEFRAAADGAIHERIEAKHRRLLDWGRIRVFSRLFPPLETRCQRAPSHEPAPAPGRGPARCPRGLS